MNEGMMRLSNFSHRNVDEYKKFVESVNLKEGHHLFYAKDNDIELYLKLVYDRVVNKLLLYHYKFISCPNKFRSKYKKIAYEIPTGYKKDDVEYFIRSKGFKDAYYMSESV
jgi:hypothetical protein